MTTRKTITADEALATHSSLHRVEGVEDFFTHATTKENVFIQLYRWVQAKTGTNDDAIFNRVFVGKTTMKKLLKLQRRYIAGQAKIRDRYATKKMLDEALLYSSLDLGPMETVDLRDLTGDCVLLCSDPDARLG